MCLFFFLVPRKSLLPPYFFQNPLRPLFDFLQNQPYIKVWKPLYVCIVCIKKWKSNDFESKKVHAPHPLNFFRKKLFTPFFRKISSSPFFLHPFWPGYPIKFEPLLLSRVASIFVLRFEIFREVLEIFSTTYDTMTLVARMAFFKQWCHVTSQCRMPDFLSKYP